MALLDESSVMNRASSAGVQLAPLDSHTLTDEDNGDEDLGGTFNNFNSTHLQSEAELVIQQEKNEIRVDENNIDYFEDNLNMESTGDQPTKYGEIVNSKINEIDEKLIVTKSAKVTRTGQNVIAS